jgi:tricorn protease
MNKIGYYRYPSVWNDKVIFVCEDDIWSADLQGGGVARRLTNGLGEATHAMVSPDGKHIAFTGREEGHPEVYVMPVDGGAVKRLTFFGESAHVIGWSDDSKSVIFYSAATQPFHAGTIQSVHINGGSPQEFPFGIAHFITQKQEGKVTKTALARNYQEPARWKRYRGGRAGTLWIDNVGDGNFVRVLEDLNGNITRPLWVNNRVYFISDHEGIGNVYSCNPDGEDIQKHSNQSEYYVRDCTTNGKVIVYSAGAKLFAYNIEADTETEITIDFQSPRVQTQRKFVSARADMSSYDLHPEGHSLVVTARGKSFFFGNWEGAVQQIGKSQGVRYRLTSWLNDGKRFVTISDEGGEEALEIHSTELKKKTIRLSKLDIGRPLSIEVSPIDDVLLITNHRFELIIVNLKKKTAVVADRSEYQRISGATWSPDGKWIAYSISTTNQTYSIALYDVKNKKTHIVTPPNFRDLSPVFDPEGKYLYFLSYREFNPVYDSVYFDLNFPRGMRPYIIVLDEKTPSSLVHLPKSLEVSDSTIAKSDDKKSAKKGEEKTSPSSDTKDISITLEGIDKRILALPVPEGRYWQIAATKGKVLFTSAPVTGALPDNTTSHSGGSTLSSYDFETKKQSVIANGVYEFELKNNKNQGQTLIYSTSDGLRVLSLTKAESGIDKLSKSSEPSRANGLIDLSRVKISVEPKAEWAQMYREIWRLQRDHFWVEDMSKVDWQAMYERYLPMLERVGTRSEFSDLIWELQGELGTSHAYESGGDYRRPPRYVVGHLGADFVYDKKQKGYVVKHIVQGDYWNEGATSSLLRPGVNIKKGDVILAVNGIPLSETVSPAELLVNHARQEITLTVAEAKKKKSERTVQVKTMASERRARYRDWVEANRRYVHEKTNNRIGYVHVPNMGPLGYSEFHRYFLSELEHEGIIVDVRFNGGGHVSQLILEKLARKRVGYDIKRWGVPEPYPSDAMIGPVIALTNEHAGSDGDIFSHSFKLMKLGTLVGTRTWGGVIGISPRHTLVDGSYTTQPEFSFWFKDVGWGVENYGTDPDVEVHIAPQDYAAGRDTQLDKTIEIVWRQLEEQDPSVPDFGERPDLSI